ncbi:cytochrome c oxidase subunit 3 [Polyangium spumosum]|nr:cytochrome c oxidase subunit 3 [Polyangium spumosum]
MSAPPGSVLALSRDATGARSNVVWGVAWLIVIESMVIASLLVSYFYLRIGFPSWPPAGTPLPEFGSSTVAVGLLALSVAPIAMATRGVSRGSRGRLLAGTWSGLVLLGAYLTLSLLSLLGRSPTWRTNAYGSIVWTMDGYQLMHASTLLVLWSALVVLAHRGHFDERRHAAIQAAALYWYFTAASSLVVHATIHLAPRVLG